MRSLSCLHAGSLQIQKVPRVFRPVPEREGGSRREKLAPTDFEWGPQKSGLVTPSRGERSAWSVFLFSLSSPFLLSSPIRSWRAHARARRSTQHREARSRSVHAGHSYETWGWTGQTMMEILPGYKKRYAPAPSFFRFVVLPVSSLSPSSSLLLERDPSALPSMATPALHSLVDSSDPAAPFPLLIRLRVQERPFVSRADLEDIPELSVDQRSCEWDDTPGLF